MHLVSGNSLTRPCFGCRWVTGSALHAQEKRTRQRAALRMCCSSGTPSCAQAAGGRCGGQNTPLHACKACASCAREGLACALWEHNHGGMQVMELACVQR